MLLSEKIFLHVQIERIYNQYFFIGPDSNFSLAARIQ